MEKTTVKPRSQRRREAKAEIKANGAPGGVVVPTGPPVIVIPPMGLELFQVSQIAAQRFQDWITGFLAGQGHTANYDLQAVPGGLQLVRHADQAPMPSRDDQDDQDRVPVN